LIQLKPPLQKWLELSNSGGQERDLRLVADYSMPNVSAKVVRIVHSYTDYVNRVVWKKY
jgi:UDP-N-acetylglucosamine 2-epimerase